MPIRRLNDDERRLGEFWTNPPSSFQKPLLKQIKIESAGGLRGVKGLIVEFRYPITVICGKNGVGKTTVLALAALTYHSPRGWKVYRGQLRSNPRSNDRDYYRFEDFFFKGHGDTQITDAKISWTHFYQGREITKSFTKTGNRWMRSDRRIEREVDYIPVNRIIPAIEMQPLRKVFSLAPTASETSAIDPQTRSRLSTILGREYREANIQKKGRFTLQRCLSNASYTGFNMGAGESCLITLMERVQKMQVGGLIVIEEIELGLHPEAQVNLAKELIKICLEKKIQIICSTHSEKFLGALPKQARLLLVHQGATHEARLAPSAKLALAEITGQTQPELLIYCEDEFASILIQECLGIELRSRVKIQKVGSYSALGYQAISHERSESEITALSVFDGDVTATQIQQVLTTASDGVSYNPQFLSLPGDNLPPEKWAVAELRKPDYTRAFSEELRCDLSQSQEFIEKMAVEMNHHNIGYCLERLTSIEKVDCLKKIAKALVPRHPQFDPIRDKVKELLNEQW